jgi:hypothetical protein
MFQAPFLVLIFFIVPVKRQVPCPGRCQKAIRIIGLQRYNEFLDLSNLIPRIIFLVSAVAKANYSITWGLYDFYGGYK